jgi:hypothetical protein
MSKHAVGLGGMARINWGFHNCTGLIDLVERTRGRASIKRRLTLVRGTHFSFTKMLQPKYSFQVAGC